MNKHCVVSKVCTSEWSLDSTIQILCEGYCVDTKLNRAIPTSDTSEPCPFSVSAFLQSGHLRWRNVFTIHDSFRTKRNAFNILRLHVFNFLEKLLAYASNGIAWACGRGVEFKIIEQFLFSWIFIFMAFTYGNGLYRERNCVWPVRRADFDSTADNTIESTMGNIFMLNNI